MMLLAMLTLASRLHAITGDHENFVATYDRYASGRARRVVVAVNLEHDEGELLLVRLPDDDRGEARLLDRQELDYRPVAVRFEKLVHPKDIVVDVFVRHPPLAVVGHVTGDRLSIISDGYTGRTADLDHDGIPEIVTSGYAGFSPCGGADIGGSILRWNGRRYAGDGRHYIAFLNAAYPEYELHLSAKKHYVVHLYGRGKALLDDERMTPGKVFSTEDDCHIFAVQGAKGTWAFLEERP
jgi:hypothetical protein